MRIINITVRASRKSRQGILFPKAAYRPKPAQNRPTSRVTACSSLLGKAQWTNKLNDNRKTIMAHSDAHSA